MPIIGDPGGARTSDFLNLRYATQQRHPGHQPVQLVNATLNVNNNTLSFINDGTGVTWSQFDEPLKANAGDVTGSTNVHDAIDYVDPITGDVRLIFADDEGVFTALVNPDGTLNNGIGSDVAANYSRNGNLQDEQFFDLGGPALLHRHVEAAEGALFYASGPDHHRGPVQRERPQPTATSPGTTARSSARRRPRRGTRRPTRRSSVVRPQRRRDRHRPDRDPPTSVYEFDVPILGGNLTDFFRVNQFGQTTGLASNTRPIPGSGLPARRPPGPVIPPGGTNLVPPGGAIVNGQIPAGQLRGQPAQRQPDPDRLGHRQPLRDHQPGRPSGSPIGNAASFGDAYGNRRGGWRLLHGRPASHQSLPIQVSAIAYGAPDPNVPGGVGNLNNFIYVGTNGYSTPDPSDPARRTSTPRACCTTRPHLRDPDRRPGLDRHLQRGLDGIPASWGSTPPPTGAATRPTPSPSPASSTAPTRSAWRPPARPSGPTSPATSPRSSTTPTATRRISRGSWPATWYIS